MERERERRAAIFAGFSPEISLTSPVLFRFPSFSPSSPSVCPFDVAAERYSPAEWRGHARIVAAEITRERAERAERAERRGRGKKREREHSQIARAVKHQSSRNENFTPANLTRVFAEASFPGRLFHFFFLFSLSFFFFSFCGRKKHLRSFGFTRRLFRDARNVDSREKHALFLEIISSREVS